MKLARVLGSNEVVEVWVWVLSNKVELPIKIPFAIIIITWFGTNNFFRIWFFFNQRCVYKVRFDISSGDGHDMSYEFCMTRTRDQDDYTSNTTLENSNLIRLGSKWHTLSPDIVVLLPYGDAFLRSACIEWLR